MVNQEPVAPTHRECAYWTFVIVPPVLMLVVLAIGVWREHVANGELSNTIATHVRHKVPVGNASLTEFFDSRTNRESSATLQRIAASAKAVMGKYDASDLKDLPQLIPANDAWPSEAIARELSEASQPILDELRDLEKSDEPVWMPVLFDGFATNLEGLSEIRMVSTLATNEFQVAYHAGDSQKAADALSCLRVLAKSVDWQATMVDVMAASSIVAIHNRLIRHSLSTDFWNAEDLEQLREALKPDPVLDQRFTNMVASERAMALEWMQGRKSSMDSASMGTGPMPYGIAPTQLQSIVSWYDDVASVGGAGTPAHLSETERLLTIRQVRAIGEISINAVPFAVADEVRNTLILGSEGITRTFVNAENSRQWTCAAVAIKQFQLKEKRWPNSLDELAPLGISVGDLGSTSATGVKPFGYRVDEQGKQALLSTSDPYLGYAGVTSDSPPGMDPDKPDHVVFIR